MESKTEPRTGQFVEGAQPLGTVTEKMVIERAKEVAVIEGRNGNDYTEDDYREAYRDLTGLPGAPEAEAAASGPRAPVQSANDEQVFAEELVQQGVAEATHDSMLAGAQNSAAQDQK